jgi:nitrate/nitrite-specific signal transduction histidine kinase
LKRYAQTIIAVLLLSLAAATFFAWRSQRAVSEPLVRLAETARVVSREKNYSLRAEASHGHDEVNVLIEAFNEMLKEIQGRDTDLQQAHDGLEMRVKDRTRELKRAEGDTVARAGLCSLTDLEAILSRQHLPQFVPRPVYPQSSNILKAPSY